MKLKGNNKFFILGIIIVYILLFFIPSIYFFPIPLIVLILICNYYFDDIRKALFITAIFTIPYSWGGINTGISTFLIKTVFSFPGLILLLSLLSLKKINIRTNILPDLLLLCFWVWGITSFIFVNTTSTVLNGIFTVSLFILLFFLTKIYIKDPKVKEVLVFILISIILFESLIAIIQFLIGHPLGRFIEEGLERFPYGRLASEDRLLFRSSGTLNEPTWFARLLTMLLPVLLYKVKTIIKISLNFRLWILFLSILAIIISWTRFSILVTIILMIMSRFWINLKYKDFLNKSLLLLIPFFIGIGIILLPFINQRFYTSSNSFEVSGSFDTRLNLIQEAVSLIVQHPVFGIGIRQFIQSALENNITENFQNINLAVHNVPLLITVEMGIPAVIFFLGFIIFCYKSYFEKISVISNKKEKLFYNFAALGGVAYLLESMMGTIFISPHISLFLLYMAIISA